MFSTLSGILAVTCGLFTIGTFLPRIPIVGTLGSFILPPLVGQFIILGAVGTVLAFLAHRLGVRRTAAAFGAIGLLSTIGSAVILGRQFSTADDNGAHVGLVSTFANQLITSGATPDKTVDYTTADGKALQLDLYLPTTTGAGTAPVIIYTHGGGWVSGDRTGQAANLRWFADQGFVAASADYTLATDSHATWDTAASQVSCAFTWLGEHVAEYGGDAKRLFAWGESAGGALTLTTTYAAAQGRITSSCGGTVPTVRAVAAQYPGVDLTGIYHNPDLVLGAGVKSMVTRYLGGAPEEHPDRLRAVSPATYITASAPPTLMFINASDHLVPREGADTFTTQAQNAGVDVTKVVSPWADHTITLQFHGAPNQMALQLMLKHFQKHDSK